MAPLLNQLITLRSFDFNVRTYPIQVKRTSDDFIVADDDVRLECNSFEVLGANAAVKSIRVRANVIATIGGDDITVSGPGGPRYAPTTSGYEISYRYTIGAGSEMSVSDFPFVLSQNSTIELINNGQYPQFISANVPDEYQHRVRQRITSFFVRDFNNTAIAFDQITPVPDGEIGTQSEIWAQFIDSRYIEVLDRNNQIVVAKEREYRVRRDALFDVIIRLDAIVDGVLWNVVSVQNIPDTDFGRMTLRSTQPGNFSQAT